MYKWGMSLARVHHLLGFMTSASDGKKNKLVRPGFVARILDSLFNLTLFFFYGFVTNGNCAGVTYSNRIDTYALEFINSFLP